MPNVAPRRAERAQTADLAVKNFAWRRQTRPTVLAWSPDHASGSTEGLQEFGDLGSDACRGQETVAQQGFSQESGITRLPTPAASLILLLCLEFRPAPGALELLAVAIQLPLIAPDRRRQTHQSFVRSHRLLVRRHRLLV